MDRRSAAQDIRTYLGDRLVHHNTWGSRYDYSQNAEWTPFIPERGALHHHGEHAQLPRIEARAAELGGDLSAQVTAEIEQIRRVDDIHAKWSRAFAYGLGAGHLTGKLYEGRSAWIRWAAHLGDYDNDGIPAQLEIFPLYMPMGSRDAGLPDSLIDAHETVAEMLNELFGIPNKRWVGHADIAGGTSCPGLWRPYLAEHYEGGQVAPSPSPPTQEDEETMRQGDSGGSVKWLQKRLTAHGIRTKQDGEYGPKTTASVTKFQKAKKFTETGDADAVTVLYLGKTKR